ARPAPFLGNHHPAAAQLSQLAKLRHGIFMRALVFADHRAHLRLHELAHGVANQKLIACERKIHSERCTSDASTAHAPRQSSPPRLRHTTTSTIPAISSSAPEKP